MTDTATDIIVMPTVLAVPMFIGLLGLLALINLAGDRKHADNKRRAQQDGYAHDPIYRTVSAWDGFTGRLMWVGFIAALVKVIQIFGG